MLSDLLSEVLSLAVCVEFVLLELSSAEADSVLLESDVEVVPLPAHAVRHAAANIAAVALKKLVYPHLCLLLILWVQRYNSIV